MESKKNITVFGATGKIGRELVKFLLQANVEVIAITRDKNKATTMPHVEWMEADMANKESLYDTMKDSRSVFLLSGQGPNLVEEQNNVIQAAKTAGVKHIVKLSSGAVDENSPFYIPGMFFAKVHADVEALLKASDIPYTMLQPNGFMQNWLGELSQTVKQERKIYDAAGDGKRAYLDIRDIAETAFRILTEPKCHINKTYLLTGGEALNYTEIAKLVSNVIGEKVTFIPLSSDEAHQLMEQRGVPLIAIKTLLAYSEAQRNGKASFVSNTVPEILHKPARTVEAFIKDHADWFK